MVTSLLLKGVVYGARLDTFRDDPKPEAMAELDGGEDESSGHG